MCHQVSKGNYRWLTECTVTYPFIRGAGRQIPQHTGWAESRSEHVTELNACTKTLTAENPKRRWGRKRTGNHFHKSIPRVWQTIDLMETLVFHPCVPLADFCTSLSVFVCGGGAATFFLPNNSMASTASVTACIDTLLVQTHPLALVFTVGRLM